LRNLYRIAHSERRWKSGITRVRLPGKTQPSQSPALIPSAAAPAAWQCWQRCAGPHAWSAGWRQSDGRARRNKTVRRGTSACRGKQATPAEIFDIVFHWLGRPMELIMLLVHPRLQMRRSPLFPKQRTANWSRATILGTLLFAPLNSLAQDTGALPSGKPNPLYPDEAEITFQWNYECPIHRPCTFVCRGAGGAGGSDHVIRLDIYLGTLPLNGVQQERAAAIFYDFSSSEFPHSAGFAISTGINSLSCQVNGLILKYSGPPAKKSKPDASEDVPVSSTR